MVVRIPPARRREIDDREFYLLWVQHQFQPMRAGNVLFVSIPGVTRESRHRGAEVLTPQEWLTALHSFKTPDGEESLKIVVDQADERHIGVAWSKAGLRAQRVERQAALQRDRLMGIAQPPEAAQEEE